MRKIASKSEVKANLTYQDFATEIIWSLQESSDNLDLYFLAKLQVIPTKGNVWEILLNIKQNCFMPALKLTKLAPII